MPDPNPHRAELERITDTLLDTGSDFGRVHDAAISLHALFSSIIGLEDGGSGDAADRDLNLDVGRALSPRDAGRCIVDASRTAAFLRGIHDAIVELRGALGDRPVELLYVGCGPMAPLVLPLTTRFSPREFQLTLIDAHEYSTESVQHLADALGANAWISEVWCGDAMAYTPPPGREADLLVIETMQKILEHEPQVALTRRLAPILAEGGILVPERIRLMACLADMGAEFVFSDPNTTNPRPPVLPERRRLALGTLVELTQQGLRVGIEPPDGSETPSETVLIIPDEVAELPDLMIRTTVDVFGGHRLDDYDSGISYPTLIHHLGRFRVGDRFEFSYEEGPSPGLRIRRASTP